MVKRISLKETGQAIVLYALALMGLIGFTALAIDGGMVFSDRRFDQNAADAAALAGAISAGQHYQTQFLAGNSSVLAKSFSCSEQYAIDAMAAAVTGAISRGADNSFTIENDTSKPNWVSVNCSGTIVQVHVHLTRAVKTSLIHLFYSGDVVNQVDAVANVEPPTDLAAGNAIASLSPHCQKPNGSSVDLTVDGGIFYEGGGSNKISIYNGGIYSNSCLQSDGGTYVEVRNGIPPGTIAPVGAIVYYDTNGWDQNTQNAYWAPTPEQVSTRLPVYTIDPPPSCIAGSHMTCSGNDCTMQAGTYSGYTQHNGSLTMEPGLYCFDGNFYANGGSITTSNFGMTEDGITIYMRSGNFYIGGNVDTTISAPRTNNPTNNAIHGLLIYMPQENHGTINMGGSNGAVFEGTVYAPNAWIDIGGNQSTESLYNTQIIGYVIIVHGNVNINITYDDKITAILNSKMNLAK